MSKERVALREAIVAHSRAVQQCEQAEDMLAKAQTLCASLEEQASAFDNLDADIANAQAESLKLALASGETHLPDDDVKGFAAQRIARENAQAHLRRVKSSLPLLESELEDAQNDVKRLELERDHAAEKVFCAEAKAMASDYLAQLAELRRTSYILNMMHNRQVRRAPSDAGTPSIPSHLWGSGPYRKVQTSAIVNEAVQENIIGFHEQRHGLTLRKQTGQAVAEFWSRLQQDADAMLNDEPSPQEKHTRRRNEIPSASDAITSRRT